MPQIARTTSGMEVQLGEAWIQNTINSIYTNIQLGRPIQSTWLNDMILVLNEWNTHYHRVTDLIGIDTGGNVTKYGTAGRYITSYSAQVAGGSQYPLVDYFISDTDITIAKVNKLIFAINKIRVHTHLINDAVA